MKNPIDRGCYRPLPVYTVEPHFIYDTAAEQSIESPDCDSDSSTFTPFDIDDYVDALDDWD